MNTMATAHIRPVTESAELHCQYRGQCNPQPVYLYLDTEDGEIWCEPDPEIGGGVSARVWHNIVQRWRIPALKKDAANALMAEILEDAQNILNHSSIIWNGNNHVGKCDDVAADASREIEGTIKSYDTEDARLHIWDASDYFSALGGKEAQISALKIRADMTDEEVVAAAERETSDALLNDVDSISGVREYLESLREYAQTLKEDEDA